MATLRTMPSDEPTRSAGTARVNMKFEIVVIRSRTWIARRSSTRSSGGGLMPTLAAVKISA